MNQCKPMKGTISVGLEYKNLRLSYNLVSLYDYKDAISKIELSMN